MFKDQQTHPESILENKSFQPPYQPPGRCFWGHDPVNFGGVRNLSCTHCNLSKQIFGQPMISTGTICELGGKNAFTFWLAPVPENKQSGSKDYTLRTNALVQSVRDLKVKKCVK